MKRAAEMFQNFRVENALSHGYRNAIKSVKEIVLNPFPASQEIRSRSDLNYRGLDSDVPDFQGNNPSSRLTKHPIFFILSVKRQICACVLTSP